MFNLEKEIKNWKATLRKNQALEDGYIEELESHLRDAIEKSLSDGIGEKKAFTDAVEKIGNVANVGTEYYKSDTAHINKRPPWELPHLVPMLYWNYFKVALRNLRRYKGYSFINIAGLTLGLACVLMIAMIVEYELSFDNFHKRGNRIYRIYTERVRNGELFAMAPVMYPLAQTAQEEIPEIEEGVCISQTTQLVSADNNNFYDAVYYAGNNIFNVFTINFIEGNEKTCLAYPFQVVISETAAAKYFGDINPIGRILKLQGTDTYLIAGVFSDLPKNSHLRLNIIASSKTFKEINYSRLDRWGDFGNDYTYLLLRKKADPSTIEVKLKDVLKRHTNDDLSSIIHLKIQPLREIHFSNLNYDLARTTPVLYLYIFGIIAAFILFIGCINFINLSTARSAGRFREVSVRKVLGAGRLSLIKQFLSESFIIVFISFLFAIIIAALLINEINNLLSVNLNLALLYDLKSIITALLILIAISLLSGFYPALFLSNAKPVLVLKNILAGQRKGFSFRSALVVFQFAISVFLITGTLVLYQQTDYLLSKDLGFDSEQILVFEIYDKRIFNNGKPLKNDLLNSYGVRSASFSSGTPASNTTNTTSFYDEGASEKNEVRMQVINVDYDFLKTYRMHLMIGRFFDQGHVTDDQVYMINETAMKKFGWTSIENKRIKDNWDGEPLPVIGVIKDFHYSSLREEIVPIIFQLNIGGQRFLSLKVNSTNISSTMKNITGIFKQHSPDYPLDYYFINDGFARYCKAEQTLGKLLSVFTFLAIIICSIGLFGLTAYSVEKKTKEIGIRKTLGASVTSVILLLSNEFIRLVIVANLLVWPVTYYLLNQWLNNYAYRIKFSPLIFVITFLISIFTTLLIVSYYTLKAALANPVESLRYE